MATYMKHKNKYLVIWFVILEWRKCILWTEIIATYTKHKNIADEFNIDEWLGLMLFDGYVSGWMIRIGAILVDHVFGFFFQYHVIWYYIWFADTMNCTYTKQHKNNVWQAINNMMSELKIVLRTLWNVHIRNNIKIRSDNPKLRYCSYKWFCWHHETYIHETTHKDNIWQESFLNS